MTDVVNILRELIELIYENLDHTLSLREKIIWKEDGSPVTQADYWHEKLISSFLKTKFKHLDIIAEESYVPKSPIGNSWLAIIDPIDGTENFCSGLAEWGVAISLWNNNKHQGSLLMLPELKKHLITGQYPKKYNSRILGVSSSYNKEIGKLISRNRESRILGCSVYNLYNVIRGSFNSFVNPKGAYVWDLQAGVSLALENDCKVLLNGCKYDGELLDPNKRHRVEIYKQ